MRFMLDTHAGRSVCKMKKKTINDIVVLGLGNPLMADEGIGGFLVNKLLEENSK